MIIPWRRRSAFAVDGNVAIHVQPAVITATAGTISPAGIVTAQAFGTALVQGAILPTGIASAGAFGSAAVASAVIRPTSIASAGAFGNTYVYRPNYIAPVGIASQN